MHNPSNLYQLFEKTSRVFPDDLCLLTESSQLTYKEAEREISKVYNTILHHAKNEEIIGVPTTRSIEQIIFVLAILKAEMAYLPIDFGYPKKRIESMI